MSVQATIPQRTDGRRYEAVLRLSGALSLCQEPEDLTKILSEQLREFLDFLQFYIVVYKENSTEVEWAVVGREKSLVSAYADVPVQQRPSWQAYTRQEPIYIREWNTDEGVPILVEPWVAELLSEYTKAKEHLGGRELVIDITNLSAISAAGEDALMELMDDHARFHCGVFTKEVLKQLASKRRSK